MPVKFYSWVYFLRMKQSDSYLFFPTETKRLPPQNQPNAIILPATVFTLDTMHPGKCCCPGNYKTQTLPSNEAWFFSTENTRLPPQSPSAVCFTALHSLLYIILTEIGLGWKPIPWKSVLYLQFLSRFWRTHEVWRSEATDLASAFAEPAVCFYVAYLFMSKLPSFPVASTFCIISVWFEILALYWICFTKR